MFAVIINISYLTLVSLLLMDYVIDYIKDMKNLLDLTTSTGKMLTCLFKGAIICVLTKISSDLCKENNSLLISDIIDLSGRIMLLVIAYPFIENIIKAASTFVL